jgi:hypothetical protein
MPCHESNYIYIGASKHTKQQKKTKTSPPFTAQVTLQIAPHSASCLFINIEFDVEVVLGIDAVDGCVDQRLVEIKNKLFPPSPRRNRGVLLVLVRPAIGLSQCYWPSAIG